jgi:hypothetical protein
LKGLEDLEVDEGEHAEEDREEEVEAAMTARQPAVTSEMIWPLRVPFLRSTMDRTTCVA